MRSIAVCSLILLALFLAPLGGVPATADDGETGEPLGLYLFDLGTLTAGHTQHIAEQAPGHDLAGEMQGQRPLHHFEGEEPILPLGTVDELIELIKSSVVPAYWEQREGADLRSQGGHAVLARCGATVARRIGAHLAELEAWVCRTVTIEIQTARLSLDEVRALRVGTGATLDDAKVAAVLATPAAGPALSVTVHAGQRASAWGGVRRAYVADADVEIAEKSQIAFPLVSVANLGLAADVVAAPTPKGDSVLVGLDAWWAQAGDEVAIRRRPAAVLETPSYKVLEIRAAVVSPAGRWSLVDGVGIEAGEERCWVLVRATPHAAKAVDTTPQGHALPSLPPRAIGPLVQRHFPVPVLSASPRGVRGRASWPAPSHAAIWERPELPEPGPLFPPEALVDLLRQSGGFDTWDDPATIELRNRVLIVRNTPPVLAAVGTLIDDLREHSAWGLDVETEVIEAPEDVARHLGAGGTLSADAQGLLADALASGQAVRLDSVLVTSLGGARNTVTAGRTVRYLKGMDAEVASDSSILDPIVGSYLDGIEVDVDPARSVSGEALQLDVRFLRAHDARAPRQVMVGQNAMVQLPEVETIRVGTSLHVRIGRTAVAATWGNGSRRILLLVTPRQR